MKFGKTYQEYVQGQKTKLPGVEFKKLKKILKKCRRENFHDVRTSPDHYPGKCSKGEQLCYSTPSFFFTPKMITFSYSNEITYGRRLCIHSEALFNLISKLYAGTKRAHMLKPRSFNGFRGLFTDSGQPRRRWVSTQERKILLSSCTSRILCYGSFFPALLNEMSAVVDFFNKRAQKLLELHLASGFRKYMFWFNSNLRGGHDALIEEGKDLVTYALINAVAILKILKKYDKSHCSTQGQAFKSQAQSMRIGLLQSPWLFELMAFHINLRETKTKSRETPALFEGCSLKINDGKPSLTSELFDSAKLDIDLTCSICLDTVFDPVALKCGHIFCYMCACSAASVTIVDGLKSAEPKEKCPLCREARVFQGAVHLEELNMLLRRNCREYWEQRRQTERVERVRQAKQHWEFQCQAFVGI